MNLAWLFLLLMLPFSGRAQDPVQPDTTGLLDAVKAVAGSVQETTGTIAGINDIDSIQALAAQVNALSAEVVARVEQAHPHLKGRMLEATLPDAAHIDMDPVLATEVQRQAVMAEEQLLELMPAYYRGLLQVRDLSARLASVRRLEKAHRLNAELQAIPITAAAE
jgi:hypothetical protein